MSRGALRGIVAASACAAALLSATSATAATTRYASPGGSGSACTQASPCAIQIAMNNASSGDEVIIAPGDYSPPANLFLPFNNIYAHGVAGQPMPRIHFSSGFLLSGNPGDRASYLAVDGVGSPLETTTGGAADQIIAHASGSAATACFVYATLTDSVCWASGTNARGVEAQTGGVANITLRNVTAEGTGTGGFGTRIQADSSGAITAHLTNVISRGTSSDITFNAVGAISASVDHSNYTTITTGSAAVAQTNQQTAAPIFVNAGAGDFSEAAGSPTIDAGVNSAANGPFDVLGRPRTINGTTDIGAYEYDPFAGVTLAQQKSKVKKRKTAILVGCPVAAPPPCAGTLALTFRQGKKTLTAGSANFSIQPGATDPVAVKVSKKAWKRLGKKGKLATQASATATDGAGISGTATAAVKLKLKAKKKR
jgi:hypothetical protein